MTVGKLALLLVWLAAAVGTWLTWNVNIEADGVNTLWLLFVTFLRIGVFGGAVFFIAWFIVENWERRIFR